jgi:hypothetical protein
MRRMVELPPPIYPIDTWPDSHGKRKPRCRTQWSFVTDIEAVEGSAICKSSRLGINRPSRNRAIRSHGIQSNVREVNLVPSTYFASQAIAQIPRVPINGHNLEVLSCHTLRPCR